MTTSRARMPTAAKALGALWFGAVGAIAAEAYKPLLPPETVFGLFVPICGALGLLAGWRVAGALAGRGFNPAVATGLRTSVTLLFWALLVFSLREMLLRSMNRRYGGPTEALVGTFDIMLDYVSVMGDPAFLGVLIAGGIGGGLFAEWGARRWP